MPSVSIPYLLQPDPVFSGTDYTQKLLLHTGETADWLFCGGKLDPGALPKHPEGLRALTRDLLLLDPEQRDPHWIPTFDPVLPFREGPSAGELRHGLFSMALFPVARPNETFLALVAAAEDRPPLFAGPASEGQSWTLAHRCAQTLRPDTKHRLNLARNWILSGTLAPGDDKVDGIGFLTDKLSLYAASRQWLLPAANAREIRLDTPYRLAARLPNAVAHITGEGTTEGETLPFPRMSKLHLLCGGQIEPAILSVILGKPSAVVLWHSMQNFSLKSKDFLEDMKTELGCDMEAREVPSDSLSEAERTLLNALKPELSCGTPVYFNITSGNRLMGMAVFQLARAFPNLRMIYKNADRKRDPDYDCIYFPGSQALTQLYKGEKKDPRIHWEHIFETNPEKKPQDSAAYKAFIFKTGNHLLNADL